MALRAGTRKHRTVGPGLTLELTLLVMLTWLSGMSDGDKCDFNGGIFTGSRDRNEVHEVTIKVKADARSPAADVGICLIKDGFKCLVTDGAGVEDGIFRKIERQAAQKFSDSYTVKGPPAGASPEQERAIKQAGLLPVVKWICSSGECGQDDKCAPGPPNPSTWDIEAVKTAAKAAEDKKIGEVETEIQKENDAKEEQREKEKKEEQDAAAARDRDRESRSCSCWHCSPSLVRLGLAPGPWTRGRPSGSKAQPRLRLVPPQPPQ
jgi:hypothetical protein